MMTVSQLSKRSGIAPHVVCYYSRSGLLTPARRPDNGYRSVCFVTQSESAHQRTKFGDAQTLNPRNPTLPLIAHAWRNCTSALHSYYPDSRFTFEKIRHLLALGEAGESPSQEVREFMRPCVKENRRRLFDLIVLQRRKEQAPTRWEEMPDVPPIDGSVCHLIESVAEAKIEA
jgi:MerR family transcriptional regulator, Zn(II)-responsive regulator of zntA